MQLDQDRRVDTQSDIDDDHESSESRATDRSARSGSQPGNRAPGLAAAIGRLLGGDPPIAIACYDGSRVGPDDSRRHARRPLPERAALRAHRAGRARHRARVRVRRARRRRRHLRGARRCATTLPDVRIGAERVARAGARRRRHRACGRCRRRPKRRACAAGGTRRNATRPRSRTTTTSRTTSTGSCSGRR